MFYLVEVLIDLEVADQWHSWMKDDHIPDVVATGCFEKAWMTRQPERDTDQRRAYRMLYRAKSREDFERYQSDFAAALQKDHTSRFEGRFEASRELLDIIAEVS